MTLDTLRVWLTGASSGIGEALAARLAGEGTNLAISSRRADRLLDVATKVRRADRALEVVPVDVCDRDAVGAAAREVERALGGIDLAIFNAGVGRRIRVDSFRSSDFAEVMATNFFGVLHGIEAVLPGMLARRSGRIAAVASLAGYLPGPTLAGYGTSKAALIHALESLRFDLAPHGVGVTVINPGYVRTPMTAENAFWMPALMDADRAAAIIVRGLRRQRDEIHSPARFSWLLKVLRLLPPGVYRPLMAAVVKRDAPRRP